MEGRCLITTSSACIASNGIPPDISPLSTLSNSAKLTWATYFTDTYKKGYPWLTEAN